MAHIWFYKQADQDVQALSEQRPQTMKPWAGLYRWEWLTRHHYGASLPHAAMLSFNSLLAFCFLRLTGDISPHATL